MAVACPDLVSQAAWLDSPVRPELPNSSTDYTHSSAEQGQHWYALCVRPRYEKQAARMLANKGYENLLPLYKCCRRRPDRYKEIRLPVFPGYLFCRFNEMLRLPILTTPGVLHVVGC